MKYKFILLFEVTRMRFVCTRTLTACRFKTSNNKRQAQTSYSFLFESFILILTHDFENISFSFMLYYNNGILICQSICKRLYATTISPSQTMQVFKTSLILDMLRIFLISMYF